MATKIQINDLKALTVLLNADPEFEVEFRNAVLTELHKRLIMPVVEKRLNVMIEDGVRQAIGMHTTRVTLSKPFAEAVKAAVQAEASRILKDTVAEITAEVLKKANVEENVIHAATIDAVEDYKAKVRKAMS